jgi:hypothetical protein
MLRTYMAIQMYLKYALHELLFSVRSREWGSSFFFEECSNKNAFF